MSTGTANFGITGVDWQQRINWDRLRNYRIERARQKMKEHGIGAMLLMYDENVRYVTSTLTPGWNRLKPGLRYAMLCEKLHISIIFQQLIYRYSLFCDILFRLSNLLSVNSNFTIFSIDQDLNFIFRSKF